jgi:hypothetical protein
MSTAWARDGLTAEMNSGHGRGIGDGGRSGLVGAATSGSVQSQGGAETETPRAGLGTLGIPARAWVFYGGDAVMMIAAG